MNGSQIPSGLAARMEELTARHARADPIAGLSGALSELRGQQDALLSLLETLAEQSAAGPQLLQAEMTALTERICALAEGGRVEEVLAPVREELQQLTRSVALSSEAARNAASSVEARMDRLEEAMSGMVRRLDLLAAAGTAHVAALAAHTDSAALAIVEGLLLADQLPRP